MPAATGRPTAFIPRALYGVIGCPLGHSLSPLLHNTGFQTLHIPAVYLRWQVRPEQLRDFVNAMRLLGIGGCSVTIPHKQAVMPLLDVISEQATLAGAVNTLSWRKAAEPDDASVTGGVCDDRPPDGESARGDVLCGENTDVAGFLAPLCAAENTAHPSGTPGARGSAATASAATGDDAGPVAALFSPRLPPGFCLERASVLLLGAGGAAHAAAAGLRLRGCRAVWVCTPGDARHRPLAERFGFTPLAWAERHSVPADLVINATPLGMTGRFVAESPYDFALAPASAGAVAYDIVYTPVRTRFLREAARAGRACVNGAAMFLGQADAQFRIWTGRGLPLEAKIALASALGAPEAGAETGAETGQQTEGRP